MIKLSYENIKKEFEKRGCVLLTEIYSRNCIPLEYRCSHGLSGKISIVNLLKLNKCPCQRKNEVSKRNNLTITNPDLCKEWDYEKNYPLIPSQVSFGSAKVVFWKCSNKTCGTVWSTNISNRARKSIQSGCPVCSGNVVSDKNRLSIVRPEIAKEWHPTKNIGLTPDKVSFGSNKTAWWKCSVCQHEWKSIINNRTGCCVCLIEKGISVNFVTDKNSLFTNFPNLIKEWDYEKNYPLLPENFSRSSNKKVWWVCNICGEKWKTKISHRTDANISSGCPYCYRGTVSKISNRWLDKNNISQEFREFRINFSDGTHVIVDGFDPKTNTVYEFLGDFWHGNPNKYNLKDINPINKKSFEELYRETFIRLEKIKKIGYNLIYTWETDFIKTLTCSSRFTACGE